MGESTTIREYVWASGDARIGNLCEIGSDVIAKQDAYIGEGVKINGKLVVSGTLDIGEKVEIAEGFEATGEIAVRNPMPVLRVHYHLFHDDAQDRKREGTRPDPRQPLYRRRREGGNPAHDPRPVKAEHEGLLGPLLNEDREEVQAARQHPGRFDRCP